MDERGQNQTKAPNPYLSIITKHSSKKEHQQQDQKQEKEKIDDKADQQEQKDPKNNQKIEEKRGNRGVPNLANLFRSLAKKRDKNKNKAKAFQLLIPKSKLPEKLIPKLLVNLEKKLYYPGEQVTGMVYLEVPDNCKVSSVVIQLIGKEEITVSRWVNSKSILGKRHILLNPKSEISKEGKCLIPEKDLNYFMRHQFYLFPYQKKFQNFTHKWSLKTKSSSKTNKTNTKTSIRGSPSQKTNKRARAKSQFGANPGEQKINQVLETGLYKLPFSFHLPPFLPSSFKKEWLESERQLNFGKIGYKVKAHCKTTAGEEQHDKQVFLVQQPLYSDKIYCVSKQIWILTKCCCLTAGRLIYIAHTQHEYYSLDEAIYIKIIKVKGIRRSFLDCVEGVFKRVILVKTTSGKEHRVEEELHREVKQVVKTKGNEICFFRLVLGGEKHENLASTVGLLISCQYVFVAKLTTKGCLMRGNQSTISLKFLVSQNKKTIQARPIHLEAIDKGRHVDDYMQNTLHKPDEVPLDSEMAEESKPSVFKFPPSSKQDKSSYQDNNLDSVGGDLDSIRDQKSISKNPKNHQKVRKESTQSAYHFKNSRWVVLRPNYLPINDDSSAFIPTKNEEERRHMKRNNREKVEFIKRKSLHLYYKKKRTLARREKRSLEYQQTHFPLLKPAEQRLDRYESKMIKFRPRKTEKAEDMKSVTDPEYITNDDFEEKCYVYPTFKEDYEDVYLEEHQVLKGFSKFLTKKKIDFNLVIKDAEEMGYNEEELTKLQKVMSSIWGKNKVKEIEVSRKGSSSALDAGAASVGSTSQVGKIGVLKLKKMAHNVMKKRRKKKKKNKAKSKGKGKGKRASKKLMAAEDKKKLFKKAASSFQVQQPPPSTERQLKRTNTDHPNFLGGLLIQRTSDMIMDRIKNFKL